MQMCNIFWLHFLYLISCIKSVSVVMQVKQKSTIRPGPTPGHRWRGGSDETVLSPDAVSSIRDATCREWLLKRNQFC
uniref:Uncharacterized protein n=1 Tax=Aegilops tauschii subsp. strangulata TaxID=200361 RepID=A0A453KTE6_AEGTS